MYIGRISGFLGDNITFTAEAIFPTVKPASIISINNYEINGFGDMYDTLDNIKFNTLTVDENDATISYTITSIASYFYGGRSSTGLGITKINDYAFGYHFLHIEYFKNDIISVNVAENCDIGAFAFYRCTKLTSMSLMNGTVREGAFAECYNLTTLKFGKDVVIFEDKHTLEPLPAFYISSSSAVFPVYTTIIGKYNQVLDYEWLRSGRIIREKIENYKLVFQNHYNAFVGIDIEDYSDGQVKICINDSTKTARLIEDIKTKYTGLCVVVDYKRYQFMDKIAVE